jgi:phosphoglycolate phosphatase-like HAD superfamily hydrolase
MEQVQVSTPRDSIPSWARDERTRQLNGEPPASQPQLNFIRDLIQQKDLTYLTPEEKAALERVLTEEGFWDTTTTRLTKAKAGRILDKLTDNKKVPYKPKDVGPTVDNAARLAVGVPAGRYAVEAESGELRFYKVWVSRDGARLNLYVEHGPDESDLRMQKTVLAILNKIKKAGIRECAIRYGMEIGSCSNCGARLTNRISRELGIGPVCGGRMFGDDFKLEVKAVKADLTKRGIDWREAV